MATPAPDELAALRARAYGRGGQALSAEERALAAQRLEHFTDMVNRGS